MLEAIAENAESELPLLNRAGMQNELAELAALRGRPAFYPYLGSGSGRGARAKLADGRWVIDLTLGIGVHLFGHGNLDLIATAIRAAASDLVMQGNLIFNREYVGLMRTLLVHAPSGMINCWLALSGADANENALKLVRQRRGGRPGIGGGEGDAVGAAERHRRHRRAGPSQGGVLSPLRQPTTGRRLVRTGRDALRQRRGEA